MAENRVGQTVILKSPPSIISGGCIAGPMEAQGPLGGYFDLTVEDDRIGEKTWEKAESRLQRETLAIALAKAGLTVNDLDYLFAGDLLAQCIGSSFGMRDTNVPYFGLYGACSTMAEALGLAAMTLSAGYADIVAAVTSSHFCTAERQFRQPLEYGGQRTPTSQWTVTGSGALILSSLKGYPSVDSVTCGKIVDLGIRDANNMGAAMAPAAFDTISAHLRDIGVKPDYYDLIVTGDLGTVGSRLMHELFKRSGTDISTNHFDCGASVFSHDVQDTHAGGSGCGCCASVLSGYLLHGLRTGKWRRILFCATGALMSAVSSQQGESIPGICTAISITGREV